MSNEDSSEGGIAGLEMEFMWDPAKAASNLGKHGVSFAQSATVFADCVGAYGVRSRAQRV